MVVMGWVQTHWPMLIAIYPLAVGIASIIVKATPSQKHDSVLAWIMKNTSRYVALNTDKHT